MDSVRSLLASFLLLSVLSLGAQTELPRELDSTALTHEEVLALFDGDDPATWAPERVFEEYREKSYYNEWQKEFVQSLQLRRIIDRNPAVYGELCAKILTDGTNSRLFGFATDFVDLHPDKQRARETVLAFLRRPDIELTESIAHSVASTLAEVGRSEDARALLPFLESQLLAERQDLWMTLIKFAGSEFVDLLEADIAALEAMRDRGDSGYSAELLTSKAAFLRDLKRRFEERLAAERDGGSAIADRPQPVVQSPPASTSPETPSPSSKKVTNPKPATSTPVAESPGFPKWALAVIVVAVLGILVLLIRAFLRGRTSGMNRRHG